MAKIPEYKEPIEEKNPEESFDPLDILTDGDHGIDISHHNSKVDFDQLDEQKFIFMKATEGKSFVSPVYEKRMDTAESKGIACGAYHYYKPSVDPLVQAKHFCTYSRGDLPPVLDIEDPYSNREKLIADLKIFLEYVEEACGMTPIIYSGFYYLVDLKLPESFSRYPLWLAWYTTKDRIRPPAPWKHITFWQYSETRTVKGVGKCDTNWYYKKK